MSKKILLLEPNYKNKYPPIGLMKLATYHKIQGDEVEFFKGELKDLGVQLKLAACIKQLNAVDGRVRWNYQADIIKNYLNTKQVKYIDELAQCTKPEKKVQIEQVLRYNAKFTPKDNYDRIYITTLFTFYWDITIKTIHYAKTLVSDSDKVHIGGVMASLLNAEIYKETGIKPFAGLLDKPGVLDDDNEMIIDELPLDYSILDEIIYKYPTQSAYFTYMTKGCTRKCAFCSVPKLEPTYKDKIESIDKFKIVNERFGEQRNLLLMDNNVLASPKFPEIIAEIKAMGFHKGAMFKEPNQLDLAVKNLRDGFNDKVYLKKAVRLLVELKVRLSEEALRGYEKVLAKFKIDGITPPKKEKILDAYEHLKDIFDAHRPKTNLARYVDFNQGTDARYVNDENMRLMSEIPIRPLRIAFDNIGIKKTYVNAVTLAAKYGIKDLSNYILYNFYDKPEDFYERLRLNVELGKQLNIKIFSFPMKYIPLFGDDAKHRKFIGPHWNRKFIRAVQSILNATKGIVAPGPQFFNMAFGETLEQFLDLLWMPEVYIINRIYFQNNGITEKWKEDFTALDELELIQAKKVISENDFREIMVTINNPKIHRLLSHYMFLKEDTQIIASEVKRLRSKFNRLIRKDMFIDLTLTHDFDQDLRMRVIA